MALDIDPAAVDAVVFDMGGVFVLPDPDLIAGALTRGGVALDLDPADPPARARFHRAHYAAMRSHDTVRPSGVDIGAHYLEAYLADLGLEGPALRAGLAAVATIWGQPADRRWTWRQDEAAAVLAVLTRTHLGVAVVSNCDGTAEAILAAAGVCQVGPGPAPQVAAIVDSHLVGVAKPHPGVFAPALDALGAQAQRTVYVGDSRVFDVEGAEAAGLHPVHLDPYGPCTRQGGGTGHDCVTSATELLHHLIGTDTDTNMFSDYR